MEQNDGSTCLRQPVAGSPLQGDTGLRVTWLFPVHTHLPGPVSQIILAG